MTDKRIAFLQKQIQSNLQKNWGIEELAQIVNLSPTHLLKLFRIHTGTSPIQYLRDQRLETARELLENSFDRIKEIQSQVGIHNAAHFTRDFKAKFGVTPSEYRKKIWLDGAMQQQNEPF